MLANKTEKLAEIERIAEESLRHQLFARVWSRQNAESAHWIECLNAERDDIVIAGYENDAFWGRSAMYDTLMCLIWADRISSVLIGEEPVGRRSGRRRRHRWPLTVRRVAGHPTRRLGAVSTGPDDENSEPRSERPRSVDGHGRARGRPPTDR